MRILSIFIFIVVLAGSNADVSGCNGLALCPSPSVEIELRVPRYNFVKARIRCSRMRETPQTTPSNVTLGGSQEKGPWQHVPLHCRPEHGSATLSASALEEILSEPPTKTQVMELTMEYGSVAEISGGLFNGTPNLCRLTIRENCLACVKRGWFLGLSNLQHLKLINDGISQIMDDAFEHLPKLQELSLVRNKISRVQASWFRGLTSLKELDLDKNPLVNISDINAGVPPFINLPLLNVLHLGYSSLSVLYPESLMNLTSLRELWLIDSEISDIHEGAFTSMITLKTLIMSENAITTIRKGYFWGLFSIRSLDLGANEIAHIEEDGFLGLRDAISIDLSHNKLTFIQAVWFRRLFKLRTLYLSGNNIYALEAPKWFVVLDKNPLRCSCAFVLFQRRNLREKFREYDQLTCMYPAHLQHEAVANVTMDKVICPRPAVVFDIKADGTQQNVQDGLGRTFIVKPLMPTPTYRNKTLGPGSRLFQEGQGVNFECRVYWEVAPRVTVALPGGAVFSRTFKLGDDQKVLTATQPVGITIIFTHSVKPEGFRDPFARRTAENRVSYLGRTDVVLTVHNFTSESAGMYSCTAVSAKKRKSAKLSVSLFNKTAVSWKSTPTPHVSPSVGLQFNNSDGRTVVATDKDTQRTTTQYYTEVAKPQLEHNRNQQIYVAAIGSFCAVVIGATVLLVCFVKRRKAKRDSENNDTNATSNTLSTGNTQSDRNSEIEPYMVHYFLGTPAQPGRNVTTEEPFYEMTESVAGNKGEHATKGSSSSRMNAIREEAMSDEASNSQRDDSSNREPFYEMHEQTALDQEEIPSAEDGKASQAVALPTECLTVHVTGDDDLIYAFIDDSDAATAKDAGTAGDVATEHLQDIDEAGNALNVTESDQGISESEFNSTQTTLSETDRVDSWETFPKSLIARGMESDGDVDNIAHAGKIKDGVETYTPESVGRNAGDGTAQRQNLRNVTTNDQHEVDDGHLYENKDTTTGFVQPSQDQIADKDDVNISGTKTDNDKGSKKSVSNVCGDKGSGGESLTYATIDEDLEGGEVVGQKYTWTKPDQDTGDGAAPDKHVTTEAVKTDDDQDTYDSEHSYENEAMVHSTHFDSDTNEDVTNMIQKKLDTKDGISSQENSPTTSQRDSIADYVTHVAIEDDKDEDDSAVLTDIGKNPSARNIGDPEARNSTLTAEDPTTKDGAYDDGHVGISGTKGHWQSAIQSAQDTNEDKINVIRNSTDTNEMKDPANSMAKAHSLNTEDGPHQNQTITKDDPDTFEDEHPYENEMETGFSTNTGQFDKNMAETESKGKMNAAPETVPVPRDSLSDCVTHDVINNGFESDEASGRRASQGDWVRGDGEHRTLASEDGKTDGDSDVFEDENIYENEDDARGHLDRDTGTSAVTYDPDSEEAVGRRYTWTKPDGWYIGGETRQNQPLTSTEVRPNDDQDTYDDEHLYENENEIAGHSVEKTK
ncbi:hypothetical protein Bbelb_102380 [Branchiostoma belcheri]|nr:hypothetical protein Bbelb_102380 [Branchiostoma belcheri]